MSRKLGIVLIWLACGALLLSACGPAPGSDGETSELEIDPPGVRVSYPTEWAAEEVDGGVIMATDAATVAALRDNETIDGGGLAISTLPTSELAAADPLGLINVLLENFVTASDTGWQLTGPPLELVINEQPAARLTLTRNSADDPGVMSLTAIVGPETTALVVSIDASEGGAHVERLNEVVNSIDLNP